MRQDLQRVFAHTNVAIAEWCIEPVRPWLDRIREAERQRSDSREAWEEKEEDWDMLPDVEDLEKIVERELKKLK